MTLGSNIMLIKKCKNVFDWEDEFEGELMNKFE